MARLDVFRSPNGRGYVVDVQANILSHIRTRIVVPLLPAEGTPPAASGLNPILDIFGIPHVLLPQALASIPAKILREPVTSFFSEHDRILRALDAILTDC